MSFTDQYDRYLRSVGVISTARELLLHTQNEPGHNLSTVLLNTLEQCVTAEGRVRTAAERIRHILITGEGELTKDHFPVLSGSGALQGSATEYDTACARLADLRETLQAVAAAWRDEHANTENPTT